MPVNYLGLNQSVTTSSYYHLDHLNSTKWVTDETALIEVRYEYRAFGEQLKRLNENMEELEDLATYSYGGKELDIENELYYFNARFYDVCLGRYINEDPVGDGLNGYAYCSNNPVNYVDPTGLAEIYSRSMDDRYGFRLRIGNALNFISDRFKHSLVVIDLSWSDRNAIFQYAEGGIRQVENPVHSGKSYKIQYSGLDNDLTDRAVRNILDPETTRLGIMIMRSSQMTVTPSQRQYLPKYEKLWREQYSSDDVDTAWNLHYEEITQNKGDSSIYDDVNTQDFDDMEIE